MAATSKISYGCDARHLLTRTTYGDGSPVVTRTYTLDGLPETVTRTARSVPTATTRRRVMESETLTYGGVNYPIARSYNANGFLNTLTYPEGLSVAYSPNAVGLRQPVQPARSMLFAVPAT